MAKKPNKPKEYQNIPVAPDVYASVRLIADANDRGMGDQVRTWAKRELPMCGHKLKSVDIEYSPTADMLGKMVRVGWYCPTCKRVYAVTPSTLAGISSKAGEEEREMMA